MNNIKDKLKNKVIKEFNQMFFSGKIDILRMLDYKYATDFVCSKELELLDDKVVEELLISDNSLEKLVELVLEFKN